MDDDEPPNPHRWWTIELRPELLDWLKRLPAAHLAVVAFYFDLLTTLGPEVRPPHVRQFDAKLRRLRLHLDSRSVGVVYWVGPGHRIVLLTVTMTSRTGEKRELGRARQALKLRKAEEQRPVHVTASLGPPASPGGTPSSPPDPDWTQLRDRRMAEPGAHDAYAAARLAHELGGAVRKLREHQEMSQSRLARLTGMPQSAVARFEAGGTVPTLPVLERLARALGAEVAVQLHAGMRSA